MWADSVSQIANLVPALMLVRIRQSLVSPSMECPAPT